ncbi:hypothetical protein [Ornithinibacillus contaminans]|nr:hypothetical protein [Ornithinibacillus contaminans]
MNKRSIKDARKNKKSEGQNLHHDGNNHDNYADYPITTSKLDDKDNEDM